MIAVQFTQYLRPDGRTKLITLSVADDLFANVEAIKNIGARLECEVLMNGIVSLTICDPDEGDDFDIRLTANGPDVPKAVDDLIRQFTEKKYRDWQLERHKSDCLAEHN